MWFLILITFLLRSAHGTPAKPPKDSDDPATMIALALRKRFAQMNQTTDSPEREDRDDRDSFSETSETPFFTQTTPKNPPKFKVPTSSNRSTYSPRELFSQNRPASVPSDKENGSPFPVNATYDAKAYILLACFYQTFFSLLL